MRASHPPYRYERSNENYRQKYHAQKLAHFPKKRIPIGLENMGFASCGEVLQLSFRHWGHSAKIAADFWIVLSLAAPGMRVFERVNPPEIRRCSMQFQLPCTAVLFDGIFACHWRTDAGVEYAVVEQFPNGRNAIWTKGRNAVEVLRVFMEEEKHALQVWADELNAGVKEFLAEKFPGRDMSRVADGFMRRLAHTERSRLSSKNDAFGFETISGKRDGAP